MDKHYTQVPNIYHDMWSHRKNSAVENWQLDIITSVLSQILPNNLSPSFLDLGGGSGHFSGLLYKQYDAKTSVVCVDNSSAMLNELHNIEGVTKICMDALDYVKLTSDNVFNCVLLKEMIHHINIENLHELFKNICKNLKPEGVCLIYTRPQDRIDYPFFKAALEQWKTIQPHHSVYEKSLHDVGFKTINVHEYANPIKITLKDWITFIKNRCWSNLSHDNFSDAELEKGIDELYARFGSGNSMIKFTDRILIITGSK